MLGNVGPVERVAIERYRGAHGSRPGHIVGVCSNVNGVKVGNGVGSMPVAKGEFS